MERHAEISNVPSNGSYLSGFYAM